MHGVDVVHVASVMGQFAFRDPGRRRVAIREIMEEGERERERDNRATLPDFYRNAAIYTIGTR